MHSFDLLKRKFPKRHKPPEGATTNWRDIHPGATRDWNPQVRAYAEWIEWKWGLVCSTYFGHGENDDNPNSNGEPFAIDSWFGKDNRCADWNNTKYGIEVVRFFEHRPQFFDWHYIIINHWYIYRDMVWRDYDPFSLRYCQSRGNTNKCDCDHDNHFHIQFKASVLRGIGSLTAEADEIEVVDEVPPELRGFACSH